MNQQSETTDAAALSAAVIGGGIANFTTPGPFGPYSLMISAMLLLLVLSFLWNHERNAFRSFAVAGVVAYLVLPAIGAFVDFYSQHCPKSSYTDMAQLLTWIPLTVTLAVVDQLIVQNTRE